MQVVVGFGHFQGGGEVATTGWTAGISELLSGLLLRPLVKRPFALDCRLERKPSAQSTAMQKIWVWKETTIETPLK